MAMKIPKRPGPRQDDGFYGPDSVTWQIASHPVFVIAAIRNVLYTALSSETSQAVVDHSKQFTDPIARGQETMWWAMATVYGDTAEATRAGKFVAAKHRRVRGHDPVSHTEYSPMREDLAIIGHCLIWESLLVAYETYVAELTPRERERYWQESFRAAELIGIDVQTLPQTWEDWRVYYEEELRPTLNYSTAADRIVEGTRTGQGYPGWLAPGMRVVWWLALEFTLPTLQPLERGLLGGSTSAARAKAVRMIGRPAFAIAALAPVRDLVQRAGGARTQELLKEAREISRRRDGSGPDDGSAFATPERDARPSVVGAG